MDAGACGDASSGGGRASGFATCFFFGGGGCVRVRAASRRRRPLLLVGTEVAGRLEFELAGVVAWSAAVCGAVVKGRAALSRMSVVVWSLRLQPPLLLLGRLAVRTGCDHTGRERHDDTDKRKRNMATGRRHRQGWAADTLLREKAAAEAKRKRSQQLQQPRTNVGKEQTS